MPEKTIRKGDAVFTVRSMREEDVPGVHALSVASVGEGLYSREEFTASIGREDAEILLLISESGELAGYIYLNFFSEEKAEAFAKLPAGTMQKLCSAGESFVGNIQSVVVAPAFRGEELSAELVSSALEWFASKDAETAIIVCWKHSGGVPLGKTMELTGFTFCAETKDVWYDNTTLYCPVCRGRCRCSAAVYYKKL